MPLFLADKICDYLVEPSVETKATWAIECLDDAPPSPRRSDADTAARLRRAAEDLRNSISTLLEFPIATEQTCGA